MREITGKPIKFIGMGEKIEALEPFHPDRIASRILDMGDMLSLIEDLQRKTDMGEARKFADKIKKGQGFTFEDFKAQMLQVKKMGGMGGLLSHLPGAGQLAEQVKGKLNEKMIDHMIAIIDSMTRKEREHPEIIKASRKRRIAMGAGVQISEVNQLLRQFDGISKMMKKMKGGKLGRMAGMMKSMMGAGRFPGMPGR